MLRIAVGQLRHRVGRTLALLLGIAVATGSFTVLTGAAETTRLQVRGTVEQNFRSTYDLLVRPASSYTDPEREQGLVRPNYQSGIFGGITPGQVGAIRAVTGVEVAAPVANIGYVSLDGLVEVPIRPLLNDDPQQMFRIRPVWTADRGTSHFNGAPTYVYASRNPTTVLNRVPYTRGLSNYRETRFVPRWCRDAASRCQPVPTMTPTSPGPGRKAGGKRPSPTGTATASSALPGSPASTARSIRSASAIRWEPAGCRI